MKVYYFGDYAPDYPRHYVLPESLRRAGVEIYPCHIGEPRRIKRYWQLVRKLWSIPSDMDVLLIAYSSSRYVWLARLLTRKPIVWDAFFSLYDNWVFDRKRARPGTPKAFYYWFLDFICCHSADRIILDTNANAAYFERTFKVPKKKFVRVFVGYDERALQPRPLRTHGTDKFIVEFHGGYIPVQGVEYIVEAAKLLEGYKDIHFKLIGHGQTYQKVQDLAKKLNINNVEFISPVPFEKIIEYIAQADVCIGLVGDVSRVNRAIPNKVYEASGVRRASINADTDAAHELFTDRKNILLVERGNARDLADKILELHNNPDLNKKIAVGAYEIVREKASIDVLGKELAAVLMKLVSTDSS